MKIRKSVAGIAAGTLAVAGLAVVAVPSASAATITNLNTFNAEPVNGAGVAAYNPGLTGAAAEASLTAVQNGANVDLTITLGAGPIAGFAAVAAGSYQYEFDIVDSYDADGAGPGLPVVSVVKSGNQCETDGSATTHTAVAQGDSYPGIGGTSTIPALVCTVTAPTAGGTHTYEIRNMNVNSGGSASWATRTNFDANVNRSSDPAEAATSPGFVPTSATANWGVAETLAVLPAPIITTLSVTGQFPNVPAARVGDTITFNLANWSAAPTIVKSCSNPAATVITDPSCVSTGLSIDGTSTASSVKINVANTLPALGPRVVFIDGPGAGGFAAPSRVIGFQGDRTLVLSPANGPVGSALTVSGSNWNGGQNVTVEILDSTNTVVAIVDMTDAALGTSVVSTVNSANGPGYGSFTTASSTTPAITTGIKVASNFATVRATQTTTTGPVSVTAPWEFLKATCTQNPTGTPCATQQEAKVTVTPGSLSQAATATGNVDNLTIQFPQVQTSTSNQTVNGTFNTVTVTDARGGTGTWSLTASLTNIPGKGKVLAEVGGGAGVIQGENLAFTAIGCSPKASSNSANNATAGTAGVESGGDGLAGTQTLCSTVSSTLNAQGSTSGIYDVTGSMSLTVPAYTKAVSYAGVVQVTLT